jgi:hypothetical protein
MVDTGCRPLAGVRVALYDYDVTGETDENGVAELRVPYEIPHYANLKAPAGYTFMGDGLIVSVCEPEVSQTIMLRTRASRLAASPRLCPTGR